MKAPDYRKLDAMLASGRPLTISFYGIAPKPRQPAGVYTYRGRFVREGDRLRHPDMVCWGRPYTRHVSKIKEFRYA